jgi:hypothetical protein
VEVGIVAALERGHLGRQLELRQRQLREVAATVQRLAPEGSLARLRALDAQRAAEELSAYTAEVERCKQERAAAAAAERAALEAELTAKHAEQMAKLAKEDGALLERERAAQVSIMLCYCNTTVLLCSSNYVVVVVHAVLL